MHGVSVAQVGSRGRLTSLLLRRRDTHEKVFFAALTAPCGVVAVAIEVSSALGR